MRMTTATDTVARSLTDCRRRRLSRRAGLRYILLNTFICILLVVTASVILVPAPALAESPRSLVSKGNRSLERGDFDKAIELYERASVQASESPIVTFNTGDAYYRKEDYGKARELFEQAALKAEDLSIEASAWYNMGNCSFRQGQRQVDSDMEKSLEFFQESVRSYMTALEKDPELADAAHNLEVARLVIKDLLDRINKQQEAMKEQQEKMKEIVDSLLALIEREERAIALGDSLERDPSKGTKTWTDGVKRLEGSQEGIRQGTLDVQGALDGLFPPDQSPQPVQQAQSHLDTSVVNQDDALEDLGSKEPGGAVPDQQQAVEQMKKALELLAQGEQQPQQQQQGEQEQQDQAQQEEPQQDQEQQEQQQPRDENARAIIEEEKENRKKRQQQAMGKYRKVDKDW
ncbi:MAG: tetratricopeptide repeat protein [bacterium]|nr:MAG: tetratricopeptide repeat protein [bacterium]